MVDTIEEFKEKYPYPEDMNKFNNFIEEYKNSLLLLREKARVTNNSRLYECIQGLFEEYFQYNHSKELLNHESLEVNEEFDSYLLRSVKEAAFAVAIHYFRLWKESRSIPLPNGRYNAGNFRYGDTCSLCNRLIDDISNIEKAIA